MIPEVSIVITCYNYGQYVSKCLDSVLNQTMTDFEIVLVDDGSTDDSEEKIKPFLSDSRLRYIKQVNSGQANAKNHGVCESKGRFVAFIDADDMWVVDKLEKQLPFFKNNDIGVVYSRALYIDEDGNNLCHEVEDFGKYLKPQSGYVINHLLFDNFVPFSSSIVRRELLNIGFNEKNKMAIDWELWLRLSLDWQFAYVDEKLLLYRVGHSGQMSKNAEERFRCTDRIWGNFISENGHKISNNEIKTALAHRNYLRWEYFRRVNPQLARRYFSKAIRSKIDITRIFKGFIKSILLRD